jgi:hypothetical protein
MFVESRIIDGKLQIRNEPNGEWKIVHSPVSDIVNAMVALADDERLEVMRYFCRGCGAVQPEFMSCQCWNDE